MTESKGTSIVIYNEVGLITMVATLSTDTLKHYQKKESRILYRTADHKLDYVFNGAVKRRPANPTRLDGHSLTNLPKPCVITINKTNYPCNETTAELSFPYPGTYTVKVVAWPYLDKEFQVEN